MSDEATGKPGKTWLYVAGALVPLPVVYVLSIGPVFVLLMSGLIDDGIIKSFFGPLEWFARVTDSGELVRGYIRTWLLLTHSPVPEWFSQ